MKFKYKNIVDVLKQRYLNQNHLLLLVKRGGTKRENENIYYWWIQRSW